MVRVREDEGYRIENISPERILLDAEGGGHRYTSTIGAGHGTVMAKQDGRRELCSRDHLHDGESGVPGICLAPRDPTPIEPATACPERFSTMQEIRVRLRRTVGFGQ